MKVKIGIKNIFLIIGTIFFLVGTSFSVVGVKSFFNHHKFINNSETTIAEIVDIQKEYYYSSHRTSSTRNKRKVRYYVDIEYFVDGQKYEQTLNQYSSNMYIGKEIEIYYDPDMPYNVKMGTDVISIVFLCIGTPFAIIGAIFIIVNIVSSGSKKKLMQKGEEVSGTITDVYENTNIRVNGRHPFKAEVKVINPFDGETYLYSSKNITENISHLIGQTVTVYVDKNNKRKYYVDIDSLLKQYASDNKIHDFR